LGAETAGEAAVNREERVAAFDPKAEGRDVIVTRLDAAVNWLRKNSVWPMPLGLACCGIELMAVGASRFDIARFGAEVMRFSPRQCDLMIVAGTCVYKMAGAVKRLWEQMATPKWCMAMGACASTGGMYRSYAVVQGVDRFLPVDVYVSGCPPRPEAVLEGLMALQRKIALERALAAMKTDERAAPTCRPVQGPIIVRGEYAPRFAEKQPWS
jgi:NADH-quinone oxidoreductase subunit B